MKRKRGRYMRDEIKQYITSHLKQYKEIVKEMYDNPELGDEEVQSAKLLCGYLEKQGFCVEEHYVKETGFLATYKSDKPGANIAYLCEYDALPEIGHGCGHNLIAAISLAAGCALKQYISMFGGSVSVIGTPAEESAGAKVDIAKLGLFKQYDAAMMLHPENKDCLGARTLALNPVRFEFYGKSAHGCVPYEGKSALDAAVMSYLNINLMRQFAKPDAFLHGVITHGGTAANVIPEYACLDYYFRANEMSYVQQLTKKAEECVKGACLASGCEYKMSIYEYPYDDCRINYSLCDMLKEEYIALGRENVYPVEETPGGSSDIGSVSYQCPTLHGYIKICGEEINCHSTQFADATISSLGESALYDGAIALAMMGYRLLSDKEALQKVKDEFNQQ